MPHNSVFSDIEAIASIEAFRALSPEDIRKLARIGQFIEVPRGHMLVRQGERADVLYYVLNGRFAVEVEGRPGQINEIRRGEPVGEIAFFRGGVRTANVRAKRASLVLAFNHGQIDELSRSAPRFSRALLTSLADRLGRATPRMAVQGRPVAPKTIGIVVAGHRPVDENFARRLATAMGRFGTAALISKRDLPQRLCLDFDPHDVTSWIEALEDESDFAVFDLSGFGAPLAFQVAATMDSIVFVAHSAGDPSLNEIEAAILPRAQDADLRLVLLHEQSSAVYPGTMRWLRGRPVAMHHHVARSEPEDMARLGRFLTGNARGFVASGGGAVCAAHVGVYRAFGEKGVKFDIFGGTSAGAAMAAAFAYELDAHEINARIEDMFVTRRAMGRFTIPRYSLFDHQPFDDALRAHYGDTCIEDLHRPFFALSTNLSTGEEHIHREGKVWQAVRASGAIPGLLPPFYTAKGEMLVDGCLLDNVPLRIMHRLSSGPNVVAALRLSKSTYFDVTYDELPGRWQIASSISRLLRGKPLPSAPGIAEVLMRSITLSPDTELTGGVHDLFIVPPVPEDIGVMSWGRHATLAETAYRHTLDIIGELETSGDPLLHALKGRTAALKVQLGLGSDS